MPYYKITGKSSARKTKKNVIKNKNKTPNKKTVLKT